MLKDCQLPSPLHLPKFSPKKQHFKKIFRKCALFVTREIRVKGTVSREKYGFYHVRCPFKAWTMDRKLVLHCSNISLLCYTFLFSSFTVQPRYTAFPNFAPPGFPLGNWVWLIIYAFWLKYWFNNPKMLLKTSVVFKDT